MKISELKDGDRVYAQYLVNDVKKSVTGAGKKYMTLLLQDSSGQIEAKKWDLIPEDDEIFQKGKVVSVQAEILQYRDTLQMKVLSGGEVSMAGVNWADFVPNAPVTQKELKAKLDAYIASIGNPDVKALVVAMVDRFGEKYLTYPAAVRNHHDYVSGLLYHSITMADLAVKVCEVYPSLNRDIVLGGTIVHDMGKTIELSGPQATAFTLEGKLLGHISLGQAELRECAKELGMFAFDSLPEEQKTIDHPLFAKKEIAITMEHIMLSHHGKKEFGSPVLPLTREALAVSLIDDMDAKMMILDKAYKGVEKGGYTAKIMTMDDRYFYLPTYSNEGDAPGTSLEEELEDLKD